MSTQTRDKPAAKNDAFIESRLADAKNRIRLLDVLSALLGFLGGTLAFAVLMILIDKRFVLSPATRQFALLAYLGGAGAYLFFTVVLPLRWRVNAHYAARHLEGTMPGTRNHVINWLDLHGEKVPSVLKSTLGQRAAKDLAGADVEAAISSRRALAVGAVTGLFAFIFFTLFFLLGPSPFASLIGRAFAPFGGSGGIASRTQIVILRPQDTTVTIGNAVTIVAHVGGRVPDPRDKDAPCLLYRHDQSEPYLKRFLQADESNQEWATTISPIDVGNGFFYKVTAGDAETPEYRVDVRAAPLIANFEAKYHYRPYVGRAVRSSTDRKLEDLRGTEVVITALTNRAIKDGRLEFDGSDGIGDLIRTERIDNEPNALRFRMVLDRAGKYRIRFSSIDGESYTDPTSHEVAVFPDHPPRVRITEPAKDVTLPANGRLEIKGDAVDDIGIASLNLHLHIVGGSRLKPKPYMPDQLGKQGFGTPLSVDYHEVLELSTLKLSNGKPAELKPGTEIEYWLEAADACDYLHPNVTSSQPRWKIKIADPDQDEARQQKEREQAQARQKEHEKKEAERMKKEQAEREKKQSDQQKQDGGKSGKEDKPNEKPDNKDGSSAKKPGEKTDTPKPKEGADGSSERSNQKETESTAEKLEKALKDKAKGDGKGEKDKRGEARGDDNRPGKGKDQGEKKEGDAGGKDKKPGESRGDGGQDSKNPAGSKKETGKPGEQGAARGESRPEPGSPKGEAKASSSKAESGKQPGECKECPAPKAGPGAAKGEGKGDKGQSAGERKSEGDVKPGDRNRQGEGRGPGAASKPTDRQPGDAKEGSSPAPTGPKGQAKAGSQKAGSSKTGPGPKGEKAPGQDKPSSAAGEPAQKPGESKDGGNEGRAEKSNPPGQDKPAPGGGTGEKGEKKTGADAAPKGIGESKGAEAGDSGEKGSQKEAGKKSGETGSSKDADSPGKGKEPGSGAGKTSGSNSTGERTPGSGSGGNNDDKRDPEQPEEHRASMIQLEEFRKNVDKKILKDMKMSPEQFAKFLKDYEELAKHPPKDESEAPEAIAKPQTGGTLPSMTSGRPVSKTGNGKNDGTRNDGRSQPPPGYRDSYREFLQKLEMPGGK